MKILSLHFWEVQIPLKVQFKQSNNSGTAQSLSFILGLETTDGAIGYGECCPRTYVTGETVADVISELNKIRAGLIGRTITSYEQLKYELDHWERDGIGPSIRCAVESAWLDAWSRSQDTPLPTLLELPELPALQYSLVLPLVRPEQMPRLLGMLEAFQFPSLKLKVDRDQVRNLANIRALRQHYGDDFSIRVDVNGGWSLEEAKQFLPEMLELGVNSFEQPVATNDLAGMKKLNQLFGKEVRIMADESLLRLKDAAQLLEEGICNHFNLKISKLGGIRPALKVYRLAERYGIPCQLGAHFGETSLLTMAGIVLAGLVQGKLTACEGAMGEFLLSEDICAPPYPARSERTPGSVSLLEGARVPRGRSGAAG